MKDLTLQDYGVSEMNAEEQMGNNGGVIVITIGALVIGGGLVEIGLAGLAIGAGIGAACALN